MVQYLGKDRGLLSYNAFRNGTQLYEKGKQREQEKARLVGKRD